MFVKLCRTIKNIHKEILVKLHKVLFIKYLIFILILYNDLCLVKTEIAVLKLSEI